MKSFLTIIRCNIQKKICLLKSSLKTTYMKINNKTQPLNIDLPRGTMCQCRYHLVTENINA